MSFTLYFTDDTAIAIESFRRTCGGGLTTREAALKILRLSSTVLSIENQGHAPCLQRETGKPRLFTLASVFKEETHHIPKLSRDDARTISFDPHELRELEILRDELGARGIVSKKNVLLGETLAVAADICEKIVRTMRTENSDIARLDHRKQLMRIIISGHDDLHCLNRKGFSPKHG